MVAFDARSQKQVPRLFAAGLAAGGFDEGQPGFRDIYYAHFFVSYLRDPQGNKIAFFLMIGMSLGEMISKVLTMQKNLLRTFLLLPPAR